MFKSKLKFLFYSHLGDKYKEKAEKYKRKLILSYKDVMKIFQKRKHFDLSSVQKLSEPPYYFKTSELFYFNDFYGINHILKKYAGLPDDYQFKCVIQHSVSFYDLKTDQEFDQNLPVILTTSDYSKSLYEKYAGNKKIYPISTHILYADDFYNEKKFLSEKKKLGKNLLFFPVHTACWVDVSSDTDWLIEEILKIKNEYDFDSVTICVYWLDVLKGLHKKFDRPDLNFNVVTAGHMLDPMFLVRLKTIIKLSDLCMSNSLGSYLFYAISLNRPFYLLKDNSISTRVLSSSEDKFYSDKFWELFNKKPEVIETYQLFNKVTMELTQEQLKFRDKYCDLKSFRSPQEFKEIINYTETLYNSGDYKKEALSHEIYV